MLSLPERLLRLIDRERLVSPGGRVLVAVSGGADSVALALLMREAASTGRLTLAGLLHLNHRLRAAAAADELFCRELAERLSIPFEAVRADVAERARRDGISVEEAGHRERYAFFERAVREGRGEVVATAHTRDDQAETYLLRAIRGAGPLGLAGIQPRAGAIVRPLLEVPRADLRAYLESRAQPFREDESNRDLCVPRNRVRHRLIPFLEAEFTPAIADVLARSATIARGDAEWLAAAARALLPQIVSTGKNTLSLDLPTLTRQPVALGRRVVKQVIEEVSGRAVGFEPVERVLELAADEGAGSAAIDLPGCRAERRGGTILIRPPLSRAPRSQPPRFEYRLPVPGEVWVDEVGLVISAEPAPAAADTPVGSAGSGVVAVAAGELSEPLIVRNWRPGDALRPLGLGGRKKLQDLFVDRKVARSERPTVPIVADRHKGIVWVVGHALAEDFRVTPDAAGVLVLKARKLGGLG